MNFIKSEKGFGILEAVVAIGILGAIAATYLSANSVTYKTIAIARRQSVSQLIAQTKMEQVKNPHSDGPPATGTYFDVTSPYTYEDAGDVDALESTGLDFPNYTVRVYVNKDADGNPSPIPGAGSDIQKITVIVKVNGALTFTLVDYKVNR